MIIVEGPDGAGKSTLVQCLCKELDLLEGKRGTTDRNKLYTVTVSDTMNALSDAVYGRYDCLAYVWDRLYYSELIYAPLTGRTVEFNAAQRVHVERIIEALKCPVILCLPPYPVVHENVNLVPEVQMKGVNENLEAIYRGYVDLVETSVFPEHLMTYDYTLNDEVTVGFTTLDEIKEEIRDYLHNRQERAWM